MPQRHRKIDWAVDKLDCIAESCCLCPRECKVNRKSGQTGFCGIGYLPAVNSASPHFGEESVLVGTGGSGTIFFSGCNLGCVFCQNYNISRFREGREISLEQLARLMLQLQDYNCVNINLVSPSHVAHSCASAIKLARGDGLKLPIVYNTGGYDSVETLKLLEGFIDIYMPDMKYAYSEVSKELSGAEDYPEINKAAVKEMYRQVGDLKIENGIAESGLLIRHLVLPGNLAGSFKIVDFLAKEVSGNTAINVMNQYRPCFNASLYPGINRRPTQNEIRQVRNYAVSLGFRIID